MLKESSSWRSCQPWEWYLMFQHDGQWSLWHEREDYWQFGAKHLRHFHDIVLFGAPCGFASHLGSGSDWTSMVNVHILVFQWSRNGSRGLVYKYVRLRNTIILTAITSSALNIWIKGMFLKICKQTNKRNSYSVRRASSSNPEFKNKCATCVSWPHSLIDLELLKTWHCCDQELDGDHNVEVQKFAPCKSCLLETNQVPRLKNDLICNTFLWLTNSTLVIFSKSIVISRRECSWFIKLVSWSSGYLILTQSQSLL